MKPIKTYEEGGATGDKHPLEGYRVKVIQYPYGYRRGSSRMATGHIEAVLIDEDGNYVNTLPDGRLGRINRWVGGGNNPVTYDPERDYMRGVRTAIVSLSPEELENFVDVAQTFTPGETTLGIPTAFGGEPGDYDLIDSNCAGGVCKGFGIDPESVENFMFIADPTIAFDRLLERGVDSSTGERVDMSEGVVRLVDQYTPAIEYLDEAMEPVYDAARGLKGVYDSFANPKKTAKKAAKKSGFSVDLMDIPQAILSGLGDLGFKHGGRINMNHGGTVKVIKATVSTEPKKRPPFPNSSQEMIDRKSEEGCGMVRSYRKAKGGAKLFKY